MCVQRICPVNSNCSYVFGFKLILSNENANHEKLFLINSDTILVFNRFGVGPNLHESERESKANKLKTR